MASVLSRVFAPSVLASLLIAACGGDSGDVCQVNDDCSSGLVCCKSSPSATLTERGSCAATCMYVPVDAAVVDSSAGDAAQADASEGEDAAMSVDASEEADAEAPVADAAADAAADDAAEAPDAD